MKNDTGGLFSHIWKEANTFADWLCGGIWRLLATLMVLYFRYLLLLFLPLLCPSLLFLLSALPSTLFSLLSVPLFCLFDVTSCSPKATAALLWIHRMAPPNLFFLIRDAGLLCSCQCKAETDEPTWSTVMVMDSGLWAVHLWMKRVGMHGWGCTQGPQLEVRLSPFSRSNAGAHP